MQRFKHGCSCYAVRKLARRITRYYDHRLAAEGLRTSQFSLLSFLSGPQGLPMRELAERMGMDRSTLNRNVRPLIAAGWVLQSPGKDPRTAVLQLSESGRRKQAAAELVWRQAQADFESLLGEADVARLHGAIDAALAALPSDGAPAGRAS